MCRPSMWNVGRGGQNGIRFLFILATIGCLFSAVTVRANDWDANGASPPNGTFQVANNWNPNAVPGTTDTADFNISDTYTVTFNGIAGTAVLDVLAGDVSFESDSIFLRTYNVTTGLAQASIDGGTLRVGDAGSPVFLNVTNLDMGIASPGTLYVDGVDSRLDADVTQIDAGSAATLFLQNSATANKGDRGVEWETN